MIFINPDSDKIISAREYHVEKLIVLLEQRVVQLRRSSKITNSQALFLNKIIIPKLKNILGDNPKKIKQISESISLSVIQKKAVKELFDYSKWFAIKKGRVYNAYVLAEKLDINTCVYCNRNYTVTVKDITRPQFDHYFLQAKNPLLALSFYNLIPSCSICNTTIKGKNELLLKEHLHPYMDNCSGDFRFSYCYDNDMKHSLKVKINYKKKKSKTERTLDFFKVKEVYNAHTDELNDLIKTRGAFSDKYLEILSSKILKETKIGKSELYQLAFGVYLDDNNASKRPFTKFKKDILTELGIVKE